MKQRDMKRMAVNDCYCIARLRDRARARLPSGVFDFYDGGAEDEITLHDNCDAFSRVRLLPRVLRNVSRVDMSTQLFGGSMQLPMAIAPTGAVGFGWRGGDLALAQAAAKHGIPYTLSTSATASIEQIADKAPGRLWFQAYILQDKQRLQSLIDRAKAADYEALVITVDLPVGGKRERDLLNGLSFPMKLGYRNIGQFVRKPWWSLNMLLHKPPVMPSLQGLATLQADRARMQGVAGMNYDPAFDLAALRALRDRWPGRLIIKGVVNPLDVESILAVGVDALIVSNHGGRQLDTGLATLDALPGIVRAVNQRVPVLLDGGIRRGSDVFKALALGAAGVLSGRATLFGVLGGGYEGVDRALTILSDELRRTMQLCGTPSLADIDASVLAHTSLNRSNGDLLV